MNIEGLENKRILVTGGAGFIGSHLCDFIIQNSNAELVILDDLSTGYLDNINHLIDQERVNFIQSSIVSFETCLTATNNVDIVFHLAALGSVPRSIDNPLATHEVNSTGFLNVLYAAVKNNVKRVVFSSSSSVYGKQDDAVKVEDRTGELLSPYAVTKKSNELYAFNFQDLYDIDVVGLRYFNVFGPRQNIKGPYAAVIPIFIQNLLNEEDCFINGDGSITRDFTYIENVLQANILAATTQNKKAMGQVFNIALGNTTSLIELYSMIAEEIGTHKKVKFRAERPGDIKSSLADVTKAKFLLNFQPGITVGEGLKKTVQWYKENL